mmetsp:Transcript_11099/g.10715  ORF Transcript_11099/g.10715 Transcript_11099/m.10715 type:complete len:92 (-) Transcript_11099:288-563(-)
MTKMHVLVIPLTEVATAVNLFFGLVVISNFKYKHFEKLDEELIRTDKIQRETEKNQKTIVQSIMIDKRNKAVGQLAQNKKFYGQNSVLDKG